MRGISIKAALIGAAASIALAIMIGLLGVLLALITALSIGDVTDSTSFREIPAVYTEATVVSLAILILTPIAAGYVAGRLAGSRIYANAALSAAAWILVLILAMNYFGHSTDHDSDIPIAFSWLLTYGSPAFGLIGGFVAEVRSSQLDALPIEYRPNLRSTLIATGRWILAFLIAAVTYVVALKFLLSLGAWVLSFLFAIVIAVLAGTAMAPPTQRRTAAIVFMSVVVLVPGEEVVRLFLFDGRASSAFLFFTINMLGAALSYPFLHQIFPGIFSISQKWWWLAPAHYVSWSSDERNARRGLALTGSIAAIALLLGGVKLLELAGINADYAAPLAGMIGVSLGVCTARPIFSELFPQLMRRADLNAAMRLRRDRQL
jgi:hypothetical protein